MAKCHWINFLIRSLKQMFVLSFWRKKLLLNKTLELDDLGTYDLVRFAE